MNMLIICEGNTDRSLIGIYLEKKEDYSLQKKSNFFDIELEMNQYQINLSNTENDLAIVSVGGKTRVKTFFEKTKDYVSQIREEEKLIHKIVIMVDRDNDTDNEILESIDNGIEKVNTWQKICIFNQLFEKVYVDVFLLVIPPDSTGAIERFVIDSLKKKDNFIVSEVEDMVDRISEKGYLKGNKRIKDKAKLGCILSILSPEWSLEKLTDKIKSIDWHKLDEFNSLYSKILE